MAVGTVPFRPWSGGMSDKGLASNYKTASALRSRRFRGIVIFFEAQWIRGRGRQRLEKEALFCLELVRPIKLQSFRSISERSWSAGKGTNYSFFRDPVQLHTKKFWQLILLLCLWSALLLAWCLKWLLLLRPDMTFNIRYPSSGRDKNCASRSLDADVGTERFEW